MGPDPVPELHRGVELIIRSVARMAGRQHSKKHSHNTVFTGKTQCFLHSDLFADLTKRSTFDDGDGHLLSEQWEMKFASMEKW